MLKEAVRKRRQRTVGGARRQFVYGHPVYRAQLMRQELIHRCGENLYLPYLLHEATVTSGSEICSYSSARAQCQAEIASMLETKIAAAMKRKQDNAQNFAIDATTVMFHEVIGTPERYCR